MHKNNDYLAINNMMPLTTTSNCTKPNLNCHLVACGSIIYFEKFFIFPRKTAVMQSFVNKRKQVASEVKALKELQIDVFEV